VRRHSINARLLDRFESHPSATDLGDDLLGGLGPDEGMGVLVVVGDVVVDGGDQLGHASEASSADALGCDVTEPSLH